MDTLKKAFRGDDNDDEQGIVTQISDASTLSWSTRIKGFLICFVLGIVLSVLGSIMIFFTNFIGFAILYSLGSLTALASTCFLMGPLNQIKKMFAPTRVIATIVMLVMIALTLCAALWWKNGGLCLLFVAIQFVAMAWYSISYIPYARDAVKKCFSSCIGE